jgi:hypothetical protein
VFILIMIVVESAKVIERALGGNERVANIPFFSIGVMHLGQSLVLETNHLLVIPSSFDFFSHNFSVLQTAGA